MPWISFAWTTPALLAGKKTVTRRLWDDRFAQRFIWAYRNDDPVIAYDKNPRNGGKPVATILLTEEPHKERLGDMPFQDVEAEGGLWLDRADFIAAFLEKNPVCTEDTQLWVIRFKLIEIAKAIPAQDDLFRQNP
jgi:hypothetical protein